MSVFNENRSKCRYCDKIKIRHHERRLDQHDRQPSNGCLHFSCSAVEELREGFRQLELRAKEQGDDLAAVVASSHHRLADKLVVRLGGLSVRQPNYVNHWDWADNELHDSGKCVLEMAELLERYNSYIEWLNNYEKTTNGIYDYLLDLDHTLADI
jgi:hypothetical protein